MTLLADLRGASWARHAWRLLVAVGLVAVLTACGGARRNAEQAVAPVDTPAAAPVAVVTPSAAGSAQATASAPVAAPTLAQAPTTPTSPAPTATAAPTPTPTATLAPADQLVQGIYLHRLGDYVAARTRLAALLAMEGLDRTLHLQARFLLAKNYLADDSYSETLATLEQLDNELGLAATGTTTATTATAFDRDLAGKAEYLRAVALAGLGRYGDSLAAYTRFLEAFPDLSAAVQPRIAQTYLAVGDAAGAAAAYRIAADAASGATQKVTLLEALAQAYSTLGRFPEAVAAYDEVLAVAQQPNYRARIQFLAGQTLALAGDEAAALDRWRAATDEAPTSPSAYAALVEIVDRGADFDLYQRGVIDVAAEAYLPAINAFLAYLESVPADDARAGNALHGLGLAYLGAGDFAAATDAFDRVLATYPGCDCFGQVWIDKARTLAAQGDGAGARRIYRTFARDYPDDPLAPEALWRSGLLAIADDIRVEAAVDLLSLVDAFPTSERAPQALYTVGIGAFINGLYVESADAFARLTAGYPDYRWDTAAYWRGRALQANGDDEAARAVWQALVERAPDIYYGVLAAQALQQLGTTDAAVLRNMAAVAGPASRLPGDDGSQAFAEQWLVDWLQIDPATLVTLPPEIANDPDLAIGRVLLDLDERGDGQAALERVYARHKDDAPSLYALSLEFERLNTYRLSLLAMAQLLALSPAGLVENAPIFLQERVYPRRFADLITTEAEAHGIDPLVFFSLIRQESLFEEGARSVAAAQGLAQIIPDTGQWVADRVGYPNYTNALIYRPHINVMFGAYYLDWVRDYLDGNLVSALVGYNAGPGNADIWRTNSGPDDTLFVELVGLTEPRVYVQAIVSNLYHYTRLYAAQ